VRGLNLGALDVSAVENPPPMRTSESADGRAHVANKAARAASPPPVFVWTRTADWVLLDAVLRVLMLFDIHNPTELQKVSATTGAGGGISRRVQRSAGGPGERDKDPSALNGRSFQAASFDPLTTTTSCRAPSSCARAGAYDRGTPGTVVTSTAARRRFDGRALRLLGEHHAIAQGHPCVDRAPDHHAGVAMCRVCEVDAVDDRER